MQFRPPTMQPAFYGGRHLVAWILALAAILFFPVLTTLIVGAETRYLVMSKRVGPSDWHANQIFQDVAPLDILFLGNSRMLSAIDHAALRQEVRIPGAHLNSETIGANFNGYDLIYTTLTDFFARRHARLVVVQYPDIPQIDSHPGEKYIRRLGESDPGLDVGSPALAVTDYGEMALIGPRLAVASVFRPGPLLHGGFRVVEDTPDLEQTRGSIAPDWGYQESRDAPRATFVKRVLPNVPLPAEVIRADAPLPADVKLIDRPLTPIEAAYLPAIRDLCKRNGAVLALILLPIANSEDRRTIEVSRQVLALQIPIVAASLTSMFGDATAEEIREHYSNFIHFNANGARRNTKVYGLALQTLLDQLKSE